HVVDRQKRGGRDASRGKLLEDDRRVDPAEPAAAELVADIDAGEPQLRRAAQRRDREFAALVPPGRLRQPLRARKRPRRLRKRPLLVREIEIHEARYRSGRSGATRGIRWSRVGAPENGRICGLLVVRTLIGGTSVSLHRLILITAVASAIA